jgi:hypothetical protein
MSIVLLRNVAGHDEAAPQIVDVMLNAVTSHHS